MTAGRRKRQAIQSEALEILAGNEPISLQALTHRMRETCKPDRGVYKLSGNIIAQALKGQPRIHKFLNKQGLSMYYAD